MPAGGSLAEAAAEKAQNSAAKHGVKNLPVIGSVVYCKRLQPVRSNFRIPIEEFADATN